MNKKLSDLKPNDLNPRLITQTQLDRLKKSLDEFGDLSDIVFNEKSSTLIGGHQRVKVLPPDADIVIMQRYDPPTRTGTVAEGHIIVAGEKFKYRAVSWDKTKEQAGMVAANQHGGDWDDLSLSAILSNLKLEDYSMDLLGFDHAEVEQLIHVNSYDRSPSGLSENEWDGMPEFNQEDKTSLRHVVVHFPTETDAANFFACIQQSDTGKTRSIWYPPQENHETESKRYKAKDL